MYSHPNIFQFVAYSAVSHEDRLTVATLLQVRDILRVRGTCKPDLATCSGSVVARVSFAKLLNIYVVWGWVYPGLGCKKYELLIASINNIYIYISCQLNEIGICNYLNISPMGS